MTYPGVSGLARPESPAWGRSLRVPDSGADSGATSSGPWTSARSLGRSLRSDRSLRPRAGVSAPLKTGRSSNTKTTITWASELCFWWTWARFEENNELYKIMQGKVIVHQGSIKPNDERYDLSIKDKPVKPPTSKTQKDIHSKSVFDDLELVMEISTSSKYSYG